MNARSGIIVLGLAVSLLGSGCGSGGRSGYAHAPRDPNVSGIAPLSTSGLPTIPTYIFVLTRADGTGNEYFSREYALAVLAEAGELSEYAVEVTLAGFQRIPDDNYSDSETQLDIIQQYERDWAVNGFAVVFIAQPYTPDSNGGRSAYQGGPDQIIAPFFVMHTRNLWRERYGDKGTFGVHAPVGSPDDIREMAMIWLHELGHSASLLHGGIMNPSLPLLTQNLVHPFPVGDALNTDNYYFIAPQFLALFAKKLENNRVQVIQATR